jgi:hypothetical protein
MGVEQERETEPSLRKKRLFQNRDASLAKFQDDLEAHIDAMFGVRTRLKQRKHSNKILNFSTIRELCHTFTNLFINHVNHVAASIESAAGCLFDYLNNYLNNSKQQQRCAMLQHTL